LHLPNQVAVGLNGGTNWKRMLRVGESVDP
jgi:hypothetical protein